MTFDPAVLTGCATNPAPRRSWRTLSSVSSRLSSRLFRSRGQFPILRRTYLKVLPFILYRRSRTQS
jgi:hypothetical protein